MFAATIFYSSCKICLRCIMLQSSPESLAKPQAFYNNLTFRVLIAVIIGVGLGAFFPETGAAMKPLGDVFIKMVKMIVAPIIFCTIVTGIAHVGDMKRVGKIGIWALIYFEVVTTLALVIGLVVVNVLQPGAGFDVSAIAHTDISQYTNAAKSHSTVDFFGQYRPKDLCGRIRGWRAFTGFICGVAFCIWFIIAWRAWACRAGTLGANFGSDVSYYWRNYESCTDRCFRGNRLHDW